MRFAPTISLLVRLHSLEETINRTYEKANKVDTETTRLYQRMENHPRFAMANVRDFTILASLVLQAAVKITGVEQVFSTYLSYSNETPRDEKEHDLRDATVKNLSNEAETALLRFSIAHSIVDKLHCKLSSRE